MIMFSMTHILLSGWSHHGRGTPFDALGNSWRTISVIPTNIERNKPFEILEQEIHFTLVLGVPQQVGQHGDDKHLQQLNENYSERDSKVTLVTVPCINIRDNRHNWPLGWVWAHSLTGLVAMFTLISFKQAPIWPRGTRRPDCQGWLNDALHSTAARMVSL